MTSVEEILGPAADRERATLGRPQKRSTTVSSVGDRLCALRIERGYSLAELGRLSGISKGHISNVEKGRVMATARLIEQLAPHLDAEPGPLIAMALDERKRQVERRFTLSRGGSPTTRAEITEEERIILDWLRALAPDQRAALVQLAGIALPPRRHA